MEYTSKLFRQYSNKLIKNRKGGMSMGEISIYNDAVYELIEELYRIHNREWKKCVLQKIVQCKKASYKQIKEALPEVADLLAYRCIKELTEAQILRRIEEEYQVVYVLVEEASYVKEILKEL